MQAPAITTARGSTGDLSSAEELVTQDIHTDANDHTSYTHSSLVMARKNHWEDAIKSISVQPSLIGCVPKGIALRDRGHVQEARIAFDVASMFTNQDSKTNFFSSLHKGHRALQRRTP